MNSKNCITGTTIAQIPDECSGGEFVNTNCVQTPNSIVYLDLEAGSNQTEINAALVSSLIYKDQQITEIPAPDGSETIINAGDNVTVTGIGTEENPYIINSSGGGQSSYKVYTALLSQTGTSAPTSIVLENTLGGSIMWSYDDVGNYLGTLTGAFISNKTAVFTTNSGNNNYFSIISSAAISTDAVIIASAVDNVLTDGILNGDIVEIRVYT